MATYFHGAAPEIQPDGLQTLYLMNPSYVGYTDTPAQANMVFLNSPMNQLPPNPQQHFVGIPLQQTATDSNRPMPIQTTTTHHDLSAIHQYNLYNSVRPPQQGLSLSLASGDEARIVASPNGMIGVQSVLMGSKYLKAAQQLLDEVVNVGKGGTMPKNDNSKNPMKGSKLDEEGGAGEGEGGGKRGAELSTAERHELQMKKAKLVNMLDEVEQRYRQYHHQMQIVVSSFEAVAGFGSARTYTALALQTISKQFRCLRDAISGQIRAASRSLGEEDCLGGGGSKSVGSRLRFVDHHLRQQRALQQLGMIQHNAWRPQRGLPERAVTVLRAWLFEHFLHPYPKDSDKHMLAKQTGLTRSQVSNWFINARVRLWKPMVEEMYNEETKEQEQNNGTDEKTGKSEGSASRSTSQHGHSPTRTDQTESLPPITVQSSNMGVFEMQQRLKKAQTNESTNMTNPMKSDDMGNRELLMKFMDQGGGFGAYQMGRFDHEEFAPRFAGNGVSLTLGLPHGEQHSYLSNESIPLGRRIEIGSEENDYFSLNNNNNNNPSASNPPNAYESISIQNRKRFAAQLLPDYVA